MAPPYAKIVPLESSSLTPLQRRVFWITAAAVALTRFAALSRTLWDWDEALFAAAMLEYDIADHRPHPPGFPLFIGLAKLIRPLVSGEFEALRTISLIAALFAFPAAFFLARALRFDATTSWLAGLLFAFFPNVWFFGGTGFSDVPAVVLAMGAAALLLNARERYRTFIPGCLIAAAGMAIRPQNALMALYPAFSSIWTLLRARRLAVVAIGGLVTFAIVGGAFGAAVVATGSWERYHGAVEWHRGYIMTIDSYQSPTRPPIRKLLDDFYVDPIGPRPLATTVLALVLIGLLRARRPTLETLVIFGPFAIFALFMLDHWSGNRFSIGYMPLFALAGAEGGRIIGAGAARIVRAAGRKPGALPQIVQVLLVLSCVLLLAGWTWPAVRQAASSEAPSHAAIRWIHENVDRRSTLVIHGSMWAFATYALSEYRTLDPDQMDLLSGSTRSDGLWVLSEGLYPSQDAVVFRRQRGRLADIARTRYFEVHVRPAGTTVEFHEGWYGHESDDSLLWRWMSRSSRATLPPIDGEALLRLELHIPLDALPAPPTVTVLLNELPIDTFTARESLITRSWRVNAHGASPNSLRILTDRTVILSELGISDDPRELGLQLRSIGWSAAEDF
jgi:hypothetical protein